MSTNNYQMNVRRKSNDNLYLEICQSIKMFKSNRTTFALLLLSAFQTAVGINFYQNFNYSEECQNHLDVYLSRLANPLSASATDLWPLKSKFLQIYSFWLWLTNMLNPKFLKHNPSFSFWSLRKNHIISFPSTLFLLYKYFFFKHLKVQVEDDHGQSTSKNLEKKVNIIIIFQYFEWSTILYFFVHKLCIISAF